MMPMGLLTGSNIIFGWQFNFSIMKSDRFTLPRFMSGPKLMKSIVDIEMELIGHGDVFFSVPINSDSGTTWMYFTPAHFEETLCVIKGKILEIDSTEQVGPVMAIEINEEGWKRLGLMNPFRMIDV